MKTRFIVMACTVALALSAVLAGCSSGGANSQADAFAGNWELETVGNGEEGSLSAEDVQMMKDLGLTCKLNLNADGTTSLDMFGDVTEGTWEVTGETAKITMGGAESELSIADGKLVFGSGSEQLIFVKGDETAANSSAAATSSAAAASSAAADAGAADEAAAGSSAADAGAADAADAAEQTEAASSTDEGEAASSAA